MTNVGYITVRMLTREQKETLVIELYKQGKTIREIAKQVHMSFSRISQIINRYEGTNSGKKVSFLSRMSYPRYDNYTIILLLSSF